MAFERKDFPLTEAEARILSRLCDMRVSGFELDEAEVSPFKVLWPREVLARNETSRFRLPSLLFEDRMVAALGYRNKTGFMLLIPGLPEQVVSVAASRFRRLIDTARTVSRSYDERIRGLVREADDLMSPGHPETPRNDNPSYENASDLVRAVSDNLSGNPGVRFDMWESPDRKRGRMIASLTDNGGPLSVEMFRIEWSAPRYALWGDGDPHRMSVSVSPGPLMDRGRVIRFVEGCRHQAGLKDTGHRAKGERISDEMADRLMSAVSRADLGYY